MGCTTFTCRRVQTCSGRPASSASVTVTLLFHASLSLALPFPNHPSVPCAAARRLVTRQDAACRDAACRAAVHPPQRQLPRCHCLPHANPLSLIALLAIATPPKAMRPSALPSVATPLVAATPHVALPSVGKSEVARPPNAAAPPTSLRSNP